MVDKKTVGHRQRLKDRFLAGDQAVYSEETLLELLFTYAIPQKDVRPIAQQLILKFGNFAGVLSADLKALCAVDGIKSHAATLLKLTEWIRTYYPVSQSRGTTKPSSSKSRQASLFDLLQTTTDQEITAQGSLPDTSYDNTHSSVRPEKLADTATKKSGRQRVVIPRRGSEVIMKAVLREAIELLPQLPATDSLDEIRTFLRDHLHFSAIQTRERYTRYIIHRMFPTGYADQALRTFATQYADRQELRDACFYRFCKAETLMIGVAQDLLLPAIGRGSLDRCSLREYLARRFPTSKSIKDCGQAIVDALIAGHIVKADRDRIMVAYREVLIPSFAFVLHSEFPEPGIYPIAQIEDHPALRAMLWNPDRILLSLYELRNLGLIAKVSEIDSVRQFTTKWSLDRLVEELVATEVRR